jgi:acetylornithine deacetylase/succinyl-diaminopimelate desuccinylase-like protein
VEQAWLDELYELLRIPSVSADPAHAADVRRAAEWVRDFVQRSGGSAGMTETGTHPLVVGDLPASRAPEQAPTVLLYGHFDVQPPAPLELWESPPFEPTIDGEWLVARGAIDDKGQLYMLLKAAQLLAEAGDLPVNVRIASDGEEEIGGYSVVDWIVADERGADACVIFDSGMERRGVPALSVATRGIINFHLDVRTGERDLHSGMFGNAALNAVNALVEMLGALLPRNGRLRDELRAGVDSPSDAERAAWAEQTAPAELLAGEGARPYDDRAVEEFYVRTTAQPSFDVNGILGGKPGLTNTTLPVAAQANFSLRLAPGQDAEEITGAVERLLRDAAPSGTDFELRRVAANPPSRVDPAARALVLAADAFEATVGRRPLFIRNGGTLPIMSALERKGIPAVVTGFSLPGGNIHAPNERLLLEYLPLGIETAREVLRRFEALV